MFACQIFKGLLLAVVVATAVVCGDGGLSLGEYFHRLDQVFEDSDVRFQTLSEPCEAEVSSDEVMATQCFFNASVVVFGDTINEIGGLAPPEEVKGAHAELESAGQSLFAQIDVLAERLSVVASASEMDVLLDDARLQEVSSRFDQACLVLERIAEASGQNIDLDCDDD